MCKPLIFPIVNHILVQEKKNTLKQNKEQPSSDAQARLVVRDSTLPLGSYIGKKIHGSSF